ncbi:MAG: response regulator [Gammaproteobacteria bacterium]|nr:response regulator [Gammaproteobacteria bacterium]
MSEKIVILAVDDTPIDLKLIEYNLKSLGHAFILETAANGELACQLVKENPEKFDLILLDRKMPDMDGIEILKRIKSHEILKNVPVILQTAVNNKEDIIEGMQAGAHYYLTKPYDKSEMLSIVNTALTGRLQYRKLINAINLRNNSIKLLDHAAFSFKTIEDADALAVLVANICSNPNDVVIGLSELFINAIEHGNLGVGYEEKTHLKRSGTWNDEISKRLQYDDHKNKHATLELVRSSTHITFTITDQGEGFLWGPYMNFTADRMLDNHGRGIAMANKMCFSSLEYKDKGNIVCATIEL